MMRILIIILVSLFFSCSGEDHNPGILTVATFNIAWLGDGLNDKIDRSENDCKRIAEIIVKLDADIIALQEIENERALKRLLKFLPEFDFEFPEKHGNQNTAYLYRGGIEIKSVTEFRSLIVKSGRTRPGFLLEAQKGNFDFYILNIHLKSTSRYDSTMEMKIESRRIRSLQAGMISAWADSVLESNTEQDLIVVGDFNDYPQRKKNPTLDDLYDNPNLEFLTSGLRSCRYRAWKSIDHIMVSSSAKSRYILNSVGMYDLNSALTKKEIEKISDHCPVIASFDTYIEDND